MTERQTFAVGETIRQRHLDAVDAMSDEIASLRARVGAMALASREAVELIDELNKRATSRKFWGITQTVHNKLCTIRITLARQALKDTPDAG